MPNRLSRPTMVWTGFLAGFIAGILTLVVPSLIDRLGVPIGALTGSFIGDIFGAVISVYLCVVLGKRLVWGSLGLIFGSTVAYIAAMSTTITRRKSSASPRSIRETQLWGQPQSSLSQLVGVWGAS